MKIRKHYLTLRSSLPHIPEQTPVETTVEELALLLDCTHRNMVLLLKRMQQEQWLTWTPRRGRGNRSVLHFIARKENIILQEAQEMLDKHDLRSALELVQSVGHSFTLSEHFQSWLSEQFGFRSEVQGHKRTDLLRFPLPQTIQSLDPAAIHYTAESHLVNQIFDSLVRMDAKGEHILPHLAHAWEVDDSRTIWTFYLRKGVLFHHGREMLASDAAYSLMRLKQLAPRGLYNWAYAGIASIETPNDTTVRIRLSESNEAFLAFLATNRASIVPEDACLSAGARFGKMPVGTGPFRLMGHEQGIWVLEAFQSYFQGRSFLDRVEVWTMEDTNLFSGDLQPFQVAHNVRITGSEASEWQQVRQSGMTCKFITINERKEGKTGLFNLRAAINAAVDRAYLLEQLSGDVIEAGSSFWSCWKEEDHHSEATMCNDQKSAYIQRQLEASGYNGETLLLTTIPQYEADAVLVKSACALFGIHIQIKLIPAMQFKGEERMAADLLLFAVMLDEHRELRLIDLYKSMQQHAAPEMKEMLEHRLRIIQTESDPARRREHFLDIEQQLKDRHSLLFLYRKHLKTAFHPSIRGISLDSLGWVRFRDIWFITPEASSTLLHPLETAADHHFEQTRA